LKASAGLRGLFSKNLGLARRLHDLISEHPDFEVLHEPTPYLYCFRYVPNPLSERQEEPGVRALLDGLNREVAGAVRRGGPALLMTTRVRGRVALRMPVCSHRASEEDVDATFEAAARWGRLLAVSHPVYSEKPTEMEAL
jgi:aromatic-L-amino-acid/L-tryptophan decarboxylase